MSFRLYVSFALVSVLPALAQMPASERTNQVASFELVWSTARDHNPDPKMNGVDWQAIHDSFRPRVERADSAGEVRSLLREMIGKLGMSHYSILPGDLYSLNSVPTAASKPVEMHMEPGSPPVTTQEIETPKQPVKLEVTPPSKPVVEETHSETVQFGNLPHSRLEFESRMLPGGAGYIRFNEFLDPVSLMPRFEAAMKNFAGAPGVILDLRGNPGGIGIMAMGIAGFFVGDSGHQLGEMKMRETTLKFTVFPRGQVYAGRLALLLDAGSASTTEILAQGLKDLKRARVFGTRSAGATLPSDIIRLPNGDGFQYPTASYISVNGRVLEGNGVVPDVEVRQSEKVIDAAAAWIAQP